MRDLVRDALAYTIVREEALAIVTSLYAQSKLEAVRAIETYVRDHVALIDEAEELLIHPVRMLREIRERGTVWGDCDDASMLTAALVAAIGIHVRFKAILPAPDGSYRHVIVEYSLLPAGERWIPLDVTRRGIPVYPPNWITVNI